MDMKMPKQYQETTRYLRPIKPVEFTDREMLQTIAHYSDINEVISCARLMGSRKGVIRVTLKTEDGAQKLEDSVVKRKIKLQAVALGLVDENGMFFTVVLENVPQYVSDVEVENYMGKFGIVSGSTRDYIEYKGTRIENEKRKIMFSTLYDKKPIPKELKVFGTTVFPYIQRNCHVCSNEYGQSGGSCSHISISSMASSSNELQQQASLQLQAPQSEEIHTQDQPDVPQLHLRGPTPTPPMDNTHCITTTAVVHHGANSDGIPTASMNQLSVGSPPRQCSPIFSRRLSVSPPMKSAFKQHHSTRRASVNVLFHHQVPEESKLPLTSSGHQVPKTLPMSSLASSSKVPDLQQIRVNAMLALERQLNH